MQLKYKTKFNEFKKLMYRKLQDKNLIQLRSFPISIFGFNLLRLVKRLPIRSQKN